MEGRSSSSTSHDPTPYSSPYASAMRSPMASPLPHEDCGTKDDPAYTKGDFIELLREGCLADKIMTVYVTHVAVPGTHRFGLQRAAIRCVTEIDGKWYGFEASCMPKDSDLYQDKKQKGELLMGCAGNRCYASFSLSPEKSDVYFNDILPCGVDHHVGVQDNILCMGCVGIDAIDEMFDHDKMGERNAGLLAEFIMGSENSNRTPLVGSRVHWVCFRLVDKYLMPTTSAFWVTSENSTFEVLKDRAERSQRFYIVRFDQIDPGDPPTLSEIWPATFSVTDATVINKIF